MSQIQRTLKKGIFTQQLQRTATIRNDPSVVFFKRLTRSRNNTFNKVQLPKFLRLKYPLVSAFFITVTYDYAFHFYSDVPQGH